MFRVSFTEVIDKACGQTCKTASLAILFDTYGSFICSGILLNKEWVLTTASCVSKKVFKIKSEHRLRRRFCRKNRLVPPFAVTFFILRAEESQSSNVHQVMLHPDYPLDGTNDSDKMNYDLALLRIDPDCYHRKAKIASTYGFGLSIKIRRQKRHFLLGSAGKKKAFEVDVRRIHVDKL
ncbi:hypothetical protein MHBO_002582 [Bonamia ostreae]|uniref:Peptidase S1 domain-containing protein n=1 Tax=Bonamia ostreae TaxID=126728 RepID=A0ABV2AMU8_9EUKA